MTNLDMSTLSPEQRHLDYVNSLVMRINAFYILFFS